MSAREYSRMADDLEQAGVSDSIVSSRALLVELYRKLATLGEQLHQALIRAEMAESELDAYRRTERTDA